MPSRSLHFALNHMVCPRYSIEQLMRLAVELDIDAVELRNDVGAADQQAGLGAAENLVARETDDVGAERRA